MGNIKNTEICHLHFFKKVNQIITVNISEPIFGNNKISYTY